ncbi:MAG TPA: hypothetical protein VFT69_00455 [Pseudolabrys sp.]|nr:hypothetical protein [Pseudolabrys sp.]
MPNASPRFKLSVLFWVGIGVLVVGTGPLVLFGIAFSLGFISDPNPNPIGLGLLAFFTFWPGIVIMAAGLIVSFCRYRARRRRTQ